MDRNLSNYKTVIPNLQSKVDPYFWDVVIDLYENGDFVSSVRNLISYVDPLLAISSSNEDKTKYEIPHGSAHLFISIDEEFLEVKAPFLNISNANRVPLMRKVAEINFSPLNLSHIILQDNDLLFYYKCPLHLCEPHKIYDVFKEICFYTDFYDDELINQYNASWILKPNIKHYESALLDEIWETIRFYISESLTQISYFKYSNKLDFIWDVIAITLMKIEYYASPQGFVRTEIEKRLNNLCNLENSSEKNEKGIEFLNWLLDLDKETFLNNIYIAEIFIPYKVRASDQLVINLLKPIYDEAKNEINNGDYIAAALNLTFHFYNIFYNNNVSDDIEESLTEALLQSSNQEWELSSKVLFSALEKLIFGLSEESSKKNKFFSKFFNRK